MPDVVERADDLSHDQLVRLILDVIHRSILHYGLWFTEVRHQMGTARALGVLKSAYERSLESVNWAARASRPWIQFAQFEWLKDGGPKAIIGRAGWYFYKPGLTDMLARPAKSNAVGAPNGPLAAIVDFRDQLAAHMKLKAAAGIVTVEDVTNAGVQSPYWGCAK